jgi:phage-related baseplate assembly protein
MPKPDPFSGLPNIVFAQIDPIALQQAVISGFCAAWQQDTGETLVLLPSDRRYNFLSSATAWLIGAYATLDQSAKQNLIPYSSGGFLDNVASLYMTTRLPAAPAMAQIRFQLSLPSNTTSTIPAGTQIASGSTGLVFATTQDIDIAVGLINGYVSANCTSTGTAGNGLPVGDISNLVNWSGAFLVSASNTEVTTGGAETETDTALRARLLDATDSFSPAGPKGRYKYYAEGVSSAISDVSVMGPEDGLSPGNVLVTVLLQNGVYPNQALLDSVYSTLNADTVRDLCAYLTVGAPSGVPYSVNVRYWIDQTQESNSLNIQRDVEAAVSSWMASVQGALGGAIVPSTLSAAVMAGGASSCIIDEPTARIALSLNQVGVVVDDPLVSYQGLEVDSQV